MIQEPWLGSFGFFAQTTYLAGGKIIHGCIYRKGLNSNLNLYIANLQLLIFLWDLNSKCGAMNKASFAFDQMGVCLAPA